MEITFYQYTYTIIYRVSLSFPFVSSLLLHLNPQTTPPVPSSTPAGDDDVPDLVGNFDDAAKAEQPKIQEVKTEEPKSQGGGKEAEL